MAHYTKYTKVVEAEFPRWKQHSSVPTGTPLSVVFDHYTLTGQYKDEGRVPVNLFFLCGVGMTKVVWEYHIKRLFEYSEANNDLNWQLVNCIAMDQVNHGESAVENDGKLGWEFDWREGAHDLIQIARTERLLGYNVLVGHSMGGFQSLYATTVAPLLFKFIIVVEPITHNHNTQIGIFGQKFIPALAKTIKSKFSSTDEFYQYFYKESFYKNCHEEILKRFVESELLINRKGEVTAKTSKEQQMICYLAGMHLWREGDGEYFPKHVPVPVVYIIGDNANWNDKDRVKEMLDYIPDVEKHEVVEGEHLVNIEKPNEILKIIQNSLNKRVNDKVYDFNDTTRSLNYNDYENEFNENYKKIHEKYFIRRGKL